MINGNKSTIGSAAQRHMHETRRLRALVLPNRFIATISAPTAGTARIIRGIHKLEPNAASVSLGMVYHGMIHPSRKAHPIPASNHSMRVHCLIVAKGCHFTAVVSRRAV
jgi:hypothetical protein